MDSSQPLYHYYERRNGPFLNLSDLPIAEAQRVLDEIKATSSVLAAQRYDGYLERRRELEQLARRLFIDKGGGPSEPCPTPWSSAHAIGWRPGTRSRLA